MLDSNADLSFVYCLSFSLSLLLFLLLLSLSLPSLSLSSRHQSYVQPLAVSLNDLLEAETRGRWWVAGARWTGRKPSGTRTSGAEGGGSEKMNREEDKYASIRVNDVDSSSSSTTTGASAASTGSDHSVDMLQLAQAQRMNTDVRRQIFATIMSATDYMDAFEKVMKLNLREKQEREIVYVLVSCCEDEPSYNPYYAHVAQKLCATLPRFKFTFQLAFWDRFKLLTGNVLVVLVVFGWCFCVFGAFSLCWCWLLVRCQLVLTLFFVVGVVGIVGVVGAGSTTDPVELLKMEHAARLLSFLLVRFSLSLAMLKVVDFGPEMSDDMIIFFHAMSTATFSDPLCVGKCGEWWLWWWWWWWWWWLWGWYGDGDADCWCFFSVVQERTTTWELKEWMQVGKDPALIGFGKCSRELVRARTINW